MVNRVAVAPRLPAAVCVPVYHLNKSSHKEISPGFYIASRFMRNAMLDEDATMLLAECCVSLTGMV
jgi:hypothetical protein